MSLQNRGDDIKHAVESVLLAQQRLSGDMEASEYEQTIQQTVDAVRQALPNSFEYDIVSNANIGLGLRIKTGCPKCGNRNIFNTQIKHPYAQLVGRPTHDAGSADGSQTANNENAGTVCVIDDADVSFKHISCGNCGAILHEDADTEEEACQ